MRDFRKRRFSKVDVEKATDGFFNSLLDQSLLTVFQPGLEFRDLLLLHLHDPGQDRNDIHRA